ncbi:MAG: TetR/AcrR family transcriptional regulator [Pseudomonadota bacterium]
MPQENPPSDRRSEIIDIATGLFLETGFAGTSISTVASACGITKASLYHHFTGKDQLFAACVTHGYRAALDEVKKIAHSDMDPEAKLRHAIDVLYEVTVMSSVGKMSPLIAEVSNAFPGVARSFHQDYISPQEDLIQNIIDEGVAKGVFRPCPPHLLMHVLMGPIVTLSLSRQMFGGLEDLDSHFPVEDLKNGHTDFLIQSLKDGNAVPIG